MIAPGPAPAVVDPVAIVKGEADAARAELARVDAKAAALMGWSGTAFAILAAAAGLVTLPSIWTTATVVLGAALLAAAVAVLLCVVRPALAPKKGRYGFLAHAATGDPQQLLAALLTDPTARLADEALRLATLTAAKYRRLRLAVDLLLVALAVLAAALPIGAWT
ncbi:Pycsar system effector family protein [Nonomuraea typhae]|uniref:Pycsar system effector family protein n=1 Tax=Nonomuraea typhae TaxID=2603600 RepID=UPI0012FB8FD6|nr:Pycsar system effector family protein [Nonomuraea typhae]